MMKQMKDQNTHPNVYVACFNFLNKALYSKILSRGLINNSVKDYVLKKYFDPQLYMEDEIKFQFMFFLNNLMIMQNSEISFYKFCEYIEQF